MNLDDDLSRLFAAERAEQPTLAATANNLRQLQGALGANLPGAAVAHGALKLGLSLTTKVLWGSGVALVAVATAVGVGLSAPAARQVAHRPDSSASAPSTLPVAQPVPMARLVPSSRPVPSAQLPVALASQAAPWPSARGRSQSEPASTFAEELRLMKAAKQEVDAGQDHLAQVWLDEHARLYPQGVFRSEREALSVLLGCRRSSAQGRSAAERFLSHYPGSPLVDRIARACKLTGVGTPSSGEFPELPTTK